MRLVLVLSRRNERAANLVGLNLMYDFAHRIAASEKFPSLFLGFKPLNPAFFKYHLAAPEGVKLAVVQFLYAVTLSFGFVSHDDVALAIAENVKPGTVCDST